MEPAGSYETSVYFYRHHIAEESALPLLICRVGNNAVMCRYTALNEWK
jgi:hypothetical protein